MKTIKIKWQRLVSEEQTCPRCGSTEQELEKVSKILDRSLAPLGIKVVLEKEVITPAAFKKDPTQSNRIWINGRPLEDWLNAEAGKSECCDVCGDSECRTVEVEGTVYEAIPADLIVKAGLLAAAEMLGQGSAGTVGKGGTDNKKKSGGCCH